ncbi:MAG: hypothetical protein U5L74_10910 [Ideonella sp.]|nr:hypothetical protein [Ideonella sp.]
MSASTSPTVRVLCIAWPAFLMAGVLEMLVFSVVDPAGLHWFGAQPIEWSTTAVYTVAFFVFWLAISLASALTQALTTTPSVDEKGPVESSAPHHS